MNITLDLDLSSLCEVSLWASDSTAYAKYSGGSFGPDSIFPEWTNANPEYTDFLYSQCDIICGSQVQEDYLCILKITKDNSQVLSEIKYGCATSNYPFPVYNEGYFNCSSVQPTTSTVTPTTSVSTVTPTTSVLAPTTTSISTIPTNDLESGSGEYPSDDSTNLFITVGAAGAVVVASAVAATAITACCIHKYRKSQSANLSNSEKGVPSVKFKKNAQQEENAEGEGIEGMVHVDLSY